MTADAALEAWRTVDRHPADRQFDKPKEVVPPAKPETSRLSEVTTDPNAVGIDELRKKAIEDQEAQQQKDSVRVSGVRASLAKLIGRNK